MNTATNAERTFPCGNQGAAAGASSAATSTGFGETLASLWTTLLRPIWRMTRAVRRPVVAKLDNHVTQLLSPDFRTLFEQLNKLSVQIAEANERQVTTLREMNVFVDGMLREVARLQSQMVSLSQLCSQNLAQDCGPPPWREQDAEEFAHSS